MAAVLATAALVVFAAEPPRARANVVCEIGISPGAAVTGAFGIGNPVGDACNAVTDPVVGAAEEAALGPLKDAAKSIGNGVFNQITSWATDGAVWLLGEIVELTNETTTPDLLSKGFLGQYRQMASIAVVLAAMMLILAVLESLGRGDLGMLGRVFFVNVPVAALATSAAYVVVQLLVATSDGFSEVITHSAGHDTREFFKGAIEGLSEAGGAVGAAGGTAAQGAGVGTATGAAAGAAAVPLFVGFIAAIVAAVAAFLVWIELLMRSAAIYAVALFMPLAIAASIWPRWTGALRRTGELVVVVVFSKFVIVAVIALAASLLANGNGSIEQVLSAAALLLLACFSPLALFKLVPFAEGAVAAASVRQHAAGGVARAAQVGSSVQMMRRAALTNWGATGTTGGGGAKGDSGNASGGKGASSAKGAPGRGGGAGSAKSGEAAGASGATAGAAALPLVAGTAAARKSKAGAERLAETATAQAGDASSAAREHESTGSSGAAERHESPGANGDGPSSDAATGASAGSREKATATRIRKSRPSTVRERRPANPAPAPTEAEGGKAPAGEQKAPRPSGGSSVPSSDAATKGPKP